MNEEYKKGDPCEKCHGTGTIGELPCKSCYGTGATWQAKQKKASAMYSVDKLHPEWYERVVIRAEDMGPSQRPTQIDSSDEFKKHFALFDDSIFKAKLEELRKELDRQYQQVPFKRIEFPLVRSPVTWTWKGWFE